MTRWVEVLVAVPVSRLFSYEWVADEVPLFGMRVIVPWGKQLRVGLVYREQIEPPEGHLLEQIKPVVSVLDDGCYLDSVWRELLEFASKYYHHPLGMICLEALPKALRVLNAKAQEPVMVSKACAHALALRDTRTRVVEDGDVCSASHRPVLNDEQSVAVQRFSAAQGFVPHLLYGVTGSGKTEVYLHSVESRLRLGQQVLVLLPEINLTPAARTLYEKRLAPYRVVVLHSDLSELMRTKHWFEAASGVADVVIATRLGVLTPMPRLGMVVVDEEHDSSYKQQDGMRYHARDLALMLGKLRNIPVVLGSATPSMESWGKAERGGYERLYLRQRAVSGASLPRISVVNTANFPTKDGLSEPALHALRENFQAGKQSIVFLNRRGYAPQMVCDGCGWVASCRHCSAHLVWHKHEYALRCHHCGFVEPVVSSCPTCGNQDLMGFGRGTQRIEESIAALLPEARVLRIDADSTRNKGQMEALLNQAHSGQADVLVGTQMIAKGHDFSNVSLVLALNVDSSLFSHAYRAPERLFAQLMQVAGRAGRRTSNAEMLVQTRYPDHPLFAALKAHDYELFAQQEMLARKEARMPPFSFQALIRADHKHLDRCLLFLKEAKLCGEALVDSTCPVFLCDPVPLFVVRVGGVERAQMLVESESRKGLHLFLEAWIDMLPTLAKGVRWFVDVDPTEL